MKLSNCLSEFLQYQTLKGNSIETIKDYNSIINSFITFSGDTDVSAFTADTVNKYNIYLRSTIKPVSVRTYIKHIKVFCNYLVQRNYINFNVNDIIVPKVNKTVVDILSSDEVLTLLSCLNGDDFYSVRNKSMILLMLDCGLRASEVTGLRANQLFLNSRYIKVVGKGCKERIVPLGDISLNALKVYLLSYILTDSGYVFTSANGVPLERSVFKKMFKKLSAQTGIERLHPHLLRHTFATNFLLFGKGDIYQLSMLLGHSDVSTTEVYLHYANYYKFMEHKKSFSYVDNLLK